MPWDPSPRSTTHPNPGSGGREHPTPQSRGGPAPGEQVRGGDESPCCFWGVNATRARPRSIRCAAALLPEQHSLASAAASHRGAVPRMGTSHPTAPSSHPHSPGTEPGVSPQPPPEGISCPVPSPAVPTGAGGCPRSSQRCSEPGPRVFCGRRGLGDGRVTKHRGHNPERGRRTKRASACKATHQHIIRGTARRQGGHPEHVTGHPKVLAGCTGGTHRHDGGAAVGPTQGLHVGLVGNRYSAQMSLKIKNRGGCYSPAGAKGSGCPRPGGGGLALIPAQTKQQAVGFFGEKI